MRKTIKRFGIEIWLMTDFGVPSFLGLLGPAELALVEALGNRRSYRDGETVHERGDDNRLFQVVISGSIKVMRLAADGQEMVFGAVNAGQNYGDPIDAVGGPRLLRGVARGDTEIYRFSNEAYEQLLTNLLIVRALYHIAMFRLNRAIETINDYRSLPVEVRVAKMLQSMRIARGGSQRIECVQEELAGLAGVSNVTIAKSLALLRGEGLIETGYRQVTVNDVAALDDWIAMRGGD